MCGITGTLFTKNINTSSRVDPYSVLTKLSDSDYVINAHEIDELHKFSLMYKSDINFINYFESQRERKTIKRIVKVYQEKSGPLVKNNITHMKKYDTNSWADNRDKILDTIWFLDDELTHRYNFVKNYLDQKEKHPRHTLQFFKTLNSIINSIDLLEMRGRDSLGLCLQFVLKPTERNLEWYKTNEIKIQHLSAIVDNKIVIHAIYRTFNRIGALGENSKKVLHLFRADKTIMDLIKSGRYDSISIVAHTRWASVGSVNQENVHPLVNLKRPTIQIPTILSFVNGDIYNYKKIYNNMIWEENVDYNFNEKSDSIALSYLFSEKGSFSSVGGIRRKLKNIVGSITSIVLSDEDPSKVLLIKKGNQGMFLGKNNDRIYFASDAYGLIDDCDQVYNLDDECFGLLELESMELGIKLNGINSTIEKRIQYTDYDKVIITSRDVSKKSFKHYLIKEIYETGDIVESTLRKYIKHEVR